MQLRHLKRASIKYLISSGDTWEVCEHELVT